MLQGSVWSAARDTKRNERCFVFFLNSAVLCFSLIFNSNQPAHPSLPPRSVIPLSSTDYAANGPRGGEQSTDQLRRGSHVPEVQAELLHPEPPLPPRAGGLDPGIQP